MTRIKTNPKVDVFVGKAENWRKEIEKLRRILLGCQLTEELKWGKPCYTFQGGNIVIILPVKRYCALLFFKGGLLKDPDGILVKAGENSEAGRQVRFTHFREIGEKENILKAYINQAIEVEKAGLKVQPKKVSELKIPAEFEEKWTEVPALKAAFDALTPGRQRAYLFHFGAAKQSKTRAARVEKWMPQMLKGKGLDDR